MSAASPMTMPRRRPLAAACCLLAFAAGAPAFAAPARPAATLAVSNCDDDGPGSLRAAAALAQDGDSIDLRALGCSAITLASGAIALHGAVNLLGPGADALTLDGADADRVFDHAGPGKLNLYDLTLAHGRYAGGDARGGCLRSSGDVGLVDTRISGCAVEAGGGEAAGGGVFASGQVELMNSVISGNVASGGASPAFGGGVAAATLVTKYSTIEDNRVLSPGGHGYGGGAFVDGATALLGSTIAGNEAAIAAGLVAGTDAQQSASILDSTVSGNRAGDRIGGVRAGGSLMLANSTVAFNTAPNGSDGVHLLAGAQVHSSILAHNGEVDLDAEAGVVLSGAANLILHATLALPADTIALDPRLQPLADNGGRTRTHALAADSPALDAGDNAMQFNGDQRGMEYPRTVGASTDIGAFERQAIEERIFVDGFD